MCTVSYIPINNKDFTLTSNRDESVNRAKAISPQLTKLDDVKFLFPKDSSKGGTWIGVTNKSKTLCLLNGGFIKHIPTPPYKKSRGLIVLEILKADNTLQLIDAYDFNEIEPFTLIIIENKNERSLIELVWDGEQKHITKKDDKETHIWSSSTLYNSDETNHKAIEFNQLKLGVDASSIVLRFHISGTSLNPNLLRYVNDASPIKTISVTQINLIGRQATMTYYDLLDNKLQTNQITLE
jgi:hypothetical protein